MASTYTRALVGACALAFTLGSPHIAHAGNGDKTPLSTTLRHRVTSSKRWTRERGNEIRRYSEHKNVRVELRRPLFRFRGKLVTLPMFSEKAAARRLAAGKPVGLQVRGSSMMMGWLGTVELAAHGIALQLASLAFMIPLGFSGVATVRIGNAFGRGDHSGLMRAAQTVLALGVGWGVVSAMLFVAAPGPLAALFLDETRPDSAAVLASATVLLAFAAAFQLFDCLQAVAAGLLRGLKDTRTPLLIAVFSYWVVGMPAAWLLGFPAGLGGAGVWLGLALGLSAAAVLLTIRFFRLAQPRGKPPTKARVVA